MTEPVSNPDPTPNSDVEANQDDGLFELNVTEQVDVEDLTTSSAEQIAGGPDQAITRGKKFGTFGGVFTPTMLTVLGAILFLRTGWIVGNAGLGVRCSSSGWRALSR